MEADRADRVMDSGGGEVTSSVEKAQSTDASVKEAEAAYDEVQERVMVTGPGACVMDSGNGGAVNSVADADVAVMEEGAADVALQEEGMVADRGDPVTDSGGGVVVNPVEDLDVAVVAVKKAEAEDVEALEEGMEDVNGKATVPTDVGERDSEQAENKGEGAEVEVVNEDDVSRKDMNGTDSGVGSGLKADESSPANENIGAERAPAENSSSSSDESVSSGAESESVSSGAEGESVNGAIIIDDAFVDDLDEDENGTSSVHPPKTKHELSVEDIGPVEKLRMSIEENLTILPLGNVRSVVDGLAVVEGIHPGAAPTLDEGSVLCESSRGFLGSIFETFGPVSNPFYTFRVHNEDKERITQGTEVFYVKEESGVVVAEGLTSRGCDASNIYDEEIPMEAQEASDDELETGRKSASKRRNTQKQGGRLERRPSHRNSTFRNFHRIVQFPGMFLLTRFVCLLLSASRGRGSDRNGGRQFPQRGGMARGHVAPPETQENLRTYADPGVAQLPGMPHNLTRLQGIQSLHPPPQPRQPQPPYNTMMGAPMMPFVPPMPGFGVPGYQGGPQPGQNVVPPAHLLNLISQIRGQGGSIPNGGLPTQAYGTGVIPSQTPTSYDGRQFTAISRAGQVFPPGIAAQGGQSQTQPSSTDASERSTPYQAQQGPNPDQ